MRMADAGAGLLARQSTREFLRGLPKPVGKPARAGSPDRPADGSERAA